VRSDFVVASIACDRREISLDNSCIESTSVGVSMKTNQISGEEIRGGPSGGIVRRDARTFFEISAATILRPAIIIMRDRIFSVGAN